MTDPHVVAWSDQFGALVRDKCLQMIEAIAASGWDTLAHAFEDPYDGDGWRLTYHEGDFWLTNTSTGENGPHILLDLDYLGVWSV